jgi:hypothetical protein
LIRIEHRIEIDAPAAAIWNALVGVDRYTEWNPYVLSLEGPLTAGESIRVTLQNVGDDSPFTVTPTVIAVETNRELRWQGTVGKPGVFDTEHSFSIEPMGLQSSMFTHAEEFSGSHAHIMQGERGERLEETFEAMNRALKKRAEATGLS